MARKALPGIASKHCTSLAHEGLAAYRIGNAVDARISETIGGTRVSTTTPLFCVTVSTTAAQQSRATGGRADEHKFGNVSQEKSERAVLIVETTKGAQPCNNILRSGVVVDVAIQLCPLLVLVFEKALELGQLTELDSKLQTPATELK